MAFACSASRSPDGAWRFLGGAALAALLATLPVAGQSVAAAAAKGKIEVPPGPLLVVISLSEQRLMLYGSTGLLVQSPVSSGMAGHRTPPGVFSILQRNRHHRSNIYSNAPMPYMQRLTWSGIALHGGVVPGYPASHGCIRLPHHFASQLWGMTKLGTRVVVAPDEATAVAIEHARLPAPRLTPADKKGPELASAESGTVSDAGQRAPAVRLLDPLERVRAMKGFVVSDAAAKTKAAKQAVEAAAAKAAEGDKAAAALRAAEAALAAARRRHQRAVKAAEASNAAERAREAAAAAEADLATAEREAEQARLIGAVARETAAAAEATVIETENARREADAALKAARRADEPISILVSRKAGKVFIRQAWVPIHEAPVTFTTAGRPFGTHVYMAMGVAADGETMNWVSVSLPPSALEPQRRRGKVREEPPLTGPPETAASVLERFELPEATRRFIEDRLWAGATLIVSDNAASHETAPLNTDFVVLTR